MSVTLLVLASLICRAASQCEPDCPPNVGALCISDSVPTAELQREYSVCHPSGVPAQRLGMYVPQTDASAPANIVVIANFYVGCNAGRREAAYYTAIAQDIHKMNPNVYFFTSLKGGGSGSSCVRWAEDWARLAQNKIVHGGAAQPYTINDDAYSLRDAFFTNPYPHPSYIIIDHKGIVRDKFVGPCCGYVSYYACSDATAGGLISTMNASLSTILSELATNVNCIPSQWSAWSACTCIGGLGGTTMQSRSRTILQAATGTGVCPEASNLEESRNCGTDECSKRDCEMTAWGPWSMCSHECGKLGTKYRTRSVANEARFGGLGCPPSVEFDSCDLTSCSTRCIPVLGAMTNITVLATAADGLQSPRDLAFAPHPGRHLGGSAEGRRFPTAGEEIWVANGGDHSVSIISGVGTDWVASFTRRDRGYFHYMHNITALAFNSIPPSQSQRTPEKDTYGFFATCQYSNNTYVGLKDANYFQGPTLYDSNPKYKNLVARDGSPCTSGDQCFLLHADMLHESPMCTGIVHDPELVTHYGTVYWAIDGWRRHLIRYDFQQPHGAGFMDHSVASVRRYPEVKIFESNVEGLHQGMVIDASSRRLYIANAGSGQILFVDVDTGHYARTAREEYPIFSSRLPSFEYSIFECVEQGVFASGLDLPTGLAIDSSSAQMFVAEYQAAKIIMFDLATGYRLRELDLGRGPGLSGLALSPSGKGLFAVDVVAHELLSIQKKEDCTSPRDNVAPILNPAYVPPPRDPFALNLSIPCYVSESIPNSSLFEQVHVVRTGYGDDNIAVQNDSMVDPAAALLRTRTDCEPDSTLNFDALLLGGYFCHTCLPDGCNNGGICANVQWSGYVCDNEFYLTRSAATNWQYKFELAANHPDRETFSPGNVTLHVGRTYDFIVNSPQSEVSLADGSGNVLSGPVYEGRLSVYIEGRSPEVRLVGNEHNWAVSLKVETTTTSTIPTTTATITTTAATTTPTNPSTTTAMTTTSLPLVYLGDSEPAGRPAGQPAVTSTTALPTNATPTTALPTNARPTTALPTNATPTTSATSNASSTRAATAAPKVSFSLRSPSTTSAAFSGTASGGNDSNGSPFLKRLVVKLTLIIPVGLLC